MSTNRRVPLSTRMADSGRFSAGRNEHGSATLALGGRAEPFSPTPLAGRLPLTDPSRYTVHARYRARAPVLTLKNALQNYPAYWHTYCPNGGMLDVHVSLRSAIQFCDGQIVASQLANGVRVDTLTP